VHELPLQPDYVAEQAFCEAVLAHDVHGLAAPGGGELEVAVAGYHDQAVAFHPGDRL